MVKHNLLLISLCTIALTGFSQSLASLNFRYLYDPQNEIDFAMKVVNEKNKMTVYYRLLPGSSADNVKNYSISWERRDSYIERDGKPLPHTDSLGSSGKISFPTPEKPWILVARISSSSSNKRWTYFQTLDAKYPVDGFLEGDEGIVFTPFVKAGGEYVFRGRQDKPMHVFYYKTDFPPASPPFAAKGPSIDRFMFADSTFRITNGSKVLLKSKGLYLVQQDTLATEGFAFRVVGNSFPKFTKLQELPPPLIYVCTGDEYNELVAAKDDKSKVDKVILDITKNTERAKNFMRSYFRRVELTNLYFSAYKEGWKTDRGMLYLIFGLPDEVSRNGQIEMWYYKDIKERFTFQKSGSIYEPQHFVLLRSGKFAANWYSTIDFWRKSRF
jgi:GWxTD domain-containing protein